MSAAPSPEVDDQAEHVAAVDRVVYLPVQLVERAKGAVRQLHGPDAQLSPLVADAVRQLVVRLEHEHHEGVPFEGGRLRVGPSRSGVERMRAPRSEAGSPCRRRHHVSLPVDLLDRATAAIVALSAVPDVPDNLSELITVALSSRLVELEASENDGAPFPPFAGRLRSGRRPRIVVR